jgi:hypothetical protein
LFWRWDSTTLVFLSVLFTWVGATFLLSGAGRKMMAHAKYHLFVLFVHIMMIQAAMYDE